MSNQPNQTIGPVHVPGSKGSAGSAGGGIAAFVGDKYKVSVTGMPFCHLCHSKHCGELAASGGFSPFGACGTTFPPLCGGTIKLRIAFRS